MTTGEFICLEEDRDEFVDFILLGVVGVIPPPTEEGGVSKRISRQQYYIPLKELMRIQNDLGIPYEEKQFIQNILARREKQRMEIRSRLAIPKDSSISFEGRLGKKHVEKGVLIAILSKFFKETKLVESELGLLSSEDIPIESPIYLQDQMELKGKVGFWRSEKTPIETRLGVFYEELMGLATKLGLSEEDTIKIVGKVRPSLAPLLRKIWEIRKLRREED